MYETKLVNFEQKLLQFMSKHAKLQLTFPHLFTRIVVLTIKDGIEREKVLLPSMNEISILFCSLVFSSHPVVERDQEWP